MTLEEIHNCIVQDPLNTHFSVKGWNPVYTAHEDAQILIVGQAPGLRAQESGIPWNDQSGDNLRSWMGVDRDIFYDSQKIALVPMDFYFPGGRKRGDVPPRKGFAEKWHPLILENVPHIELTILVGTYAQAYYLGPKRKSSLTETVRNFKEYAPTCFPLVHPSPRNNIWHKKNPWFKKAVVPSLQKEVRRVLK